jgi:diphthine synthase
MWEGVAGFRMTVAKVSGLWLIGIGPGNLQQMTLEAKKTAIQCSKRYLEGYTAVLPKEQEGELENIIGKWEKVMREEIENPRKILDEAKKEAVCILVVGDSMLATTHIDLEMHCHDEGINFNFIPGLSATSLAVSMSGLQSYKFGRQVTLPYAYGNYLATSPFRLIQKNRVNNLHTLILFDLDPTGMGIETPIPMKPSEAIEILDKMYKKLIIEEEIVNLESPFAWDGILLSDLGTVEQKIVAGTLAQLSSQDNGNIHCMIIPTTFSGMEKEAFNRRRMVE